MVRRYGGRTLNTTPRVTDCTAALGDLCGRYLTSNNGDTLPKDVTRSSRPATKPDERQYRRCLASIVQMVMTDGVDGSRRLFACACRCVEHGLNDNDAVRCIRTAAKLQPFPTDYGDGEIVDRLRDAEKTTKRGKIAPEDEPVNPTTLGSLWESDPNMREPVIDGLIRRGQVGNLISTSKSFKTFLILALAICMVLRRMWLDRFPTIGGRVLIIDLELQRGDITRRTHDICRAMHADLNLIGKSIDVLCLRGRAATVDQIEKMLLAVAPRTYSLVIVDPLYKTYPADFDENSNAQMTALYRRWERMAEHLDCGLWIVHHGTKGSQSEKRVVDVGAGASAQSRSADAHIALREHEIENCVVFDARIRSFPQIEPMVIRWEYPLWSRDLSLSPEDLKTGRKSRNKEEAQPQPEPEPGIVWTPAKFVETFATDKPVAKDTIIAKANLAEMSARKASDLLRLAAHDGLIHRWAFPKDRTIYFATIPQPVTAAAGVPK